MRVFLSWSGKRSKKVARKLRGWLPKMFRNLEIWMSDRDIRIGERWSPELLRQIDRAQFAILCLTTDNLESPWIHFEAGAIAKSVGDKTFVAPYLIDIKKSAIPGPLKQFQAARATKKGTWRLVHSLALALNPRRKSLRPLEERFEELWPLLKKSIKKVKRAG